MTLGELLARAKGVEPERGKQVGQCVMCGHKTEHGLRMKDVVSANFSGWNRLFIGDCICPYCAHLFSDQSYRKKCWVASLSQGLRFPERNEMLDILFDPPEPPFFLYIKKAMGGQRQGWLCCLNRVAGNGKKYFFAHEAYDVPIWWDRDIAARYKAQVEAALNLGLNKRDILHGPGTYGYKKVIEAGQVDLVRQIRHNIGSPLWEVIVDVFPVEKLAD